MKILVHGAEEMAQVQGLETVGADIEIGFAPDEASLGQGLPGTDILLGWDFRGRDLANQWVRADSLKWIHWGGAGVDAVLFPALADSDVILTNSRGLFDRAMAEYVLGYMLAEVKGFRTTLKSQDVSEWNYRGTVKLAGSRAAVFGVGSIGREIAILLKAVDVEVTGVGRSERTGDPVFGTIRGQDDARAVAGDADWVIGVLPGTAATEGYFDAGLFGAMKSSARFINVGRGTAVDEDALMAVLGSGGVAGAMLDVFHEEPLPASSPLWQTPNLFVSPHMSGDYTDYKADVAKQFLENLRRYRAGEDLFNVVDKKLGFVAS